MKGLNVCCKEYFVVVCIEVLMLVLLNTRQEKYLTLSICTRSHTYDSSIYM